jgi:hypothetical protein
VEPDISLGVMDRVGIDTPVLSVSATDQRFDPGVLQGIRSENALRLLHRGH